MFRSVQQAFTVLAVLSVLTVAAPARAEPSEAETLGQEVATILFDAANLKGLIADSMERESASLDGFDVRPEWRKFLTDAMIEETVQDMPKLEELVGRSFAGSFTLEELRAGVTILRDPALQASIAAGAAHRDPPPGLKPSRQTEKLAATPAGRRFLEKLGKIETMLSGLENDFAAEIIPGAFRRFADKAEALEAARAAQ